jgi:S-DNA-T family DNA segregation ATPase FtsK/SpoIIIE
LYKARPDEVKLLMIDPKVVELSVYNGIPHLLIPVVTEPKKASGALSWAVAEMEKRYGMFAETGCRDLKGYNKLAAERFEAEVPQIVIIIDELADLMMSCKGEVEESICRLAQKARAAGIHLIVATQRPSVDVITGLIKANIPSRLAFAVSSGIDSRTVLDMYGAEKLLGKGDMLFLPMGQSKPIRVQGGFISEGEVENLVNFLKSQAPVEHSVEEIQRVTMPGKTLIEGDVDEFFHDAVDFLITKGKGSTSMLQRQFRIGYNRASRLMEDLQARGIVGPEDGVKPRKVTITREEYSPHGLSSRTYTILI